jgi:DNA modification methylase
MSKLQVDYIDINCIIPYENNPRKNKQAVDKVAASIQEFGFKVPILIDKNMIIIAGHTRYKAAKKLQLKEIPTIKVEDLTHKQIKALRIADNKTGEIAEWDFELLLIELEELKTDGFNLELTGFDLSEIESLIDEYKPEEIEDDGFDIEGELENIEDPLTKKGDIWLLGNHRLMCGNSTSMSEVNKLMDGIKAKMVFTDPPYNIAYEGKTEDKLTIQNDNMVDSEFYNFLLSVFKNYSEIMDEGAAIYVCHADSKGEYFRKAFREAGLKLAECIIWAKDSFVMGRQDYHWRHEPILYGWKEGKAHYFIDDRTQDTVWEIKRPKRNEEHPTMKPILLCAKAIKNSSKPIEIVTDLFGGSGSTLIACDEVDRICYTMEIDEKYCDVIVNRYIKYKGTSEDVLLIRDGTRIPYTEVI